ncbi:MAG: DNA translocase FtsK, partial [Alistipes sp.]|nr:DNA translocase FtsK [Alistipes sp.]
TTIVGDEIIFSEVTTQANASTTENSAEQPESSSDDDILFTTDDTPAEEDDSLVVKVYENQPKTLDEDELCEEPYNPLLDLEFYKKPHVSLLEDYQSPHKVGDAEIYENKCRIQETLKYFGIPIVDIEATVGPTVTLYEIKQAQGVKIAKIQSLEKDIAQSLRAQGIRIIAPIPGRGTIGIEVPNRDKQIVSMYSSICSEEFQSMKAELPIVIGRTIQNKNFTFDLAKLPHLLVAGATGQGKSVGLNAIITSLLYRKHPAELKFVMIDPKMVEFSVYSKLEKHFLAKMESEEEAIITEPKKAVYVLNSLVEEMGRRLELLKMATARNIVEYNEKFTSRRLNPNKGHRFLPYIVVIIDEFADLIMTAREVEVPVMRLAQKARAVGIHLIVATQRPDVKVITGGIKANFPSRIAFRVIQTVDSRTIIDQPGANQLIGRGDMLFSKDGDLTRIQCALVETKEVERMVDFISKQQGYTEAYPLPDFVPEGGDGGGAASDGESSALVKYDSLFGEVARSAVTNGVISISLIQRNYEVGFNRAGRIMLQLERAGIVGPQNGAKAREIKYYDLPSLEAKLQDLGVF